MAPPVRKDSMRFYNYEIDDEDEDEDGFTLDGVSPTQALASSSTQVFFPDDNLDRVLDQSPAQQTLTSAAPTVNTANNIRSTSESTSTTTIHDNRTNNSNFNITNIINNHHPSQGEDLNAVLAVAENLRIPPSPEDCTTTRATAAPFWAVKLVLWCFQILLAPVWFLWRVCRFYVLVGVLGMMLLLLIAVGLSILISALLSQFSGFLRWVPLPSVVATAAAPLAGIWSIILAVFPNLSRSTGSGSGVVIVTNTAAATDATPLNALLSSKDILLSSKTLDATPLSVPSIIIWEHGYKDLASSVVYYATDIEYPSTLSMAIATPIVAAERALIKITQAYEAAAALKQDINKQLGEEALLARRLERKIKHRDMEIDAVLQRQAAEFDELEQGRITASLNRAARHAWAKAGQIQRLVWGMMSSGPDVGDDQADSPRPVLGLQTHVMLEGVLHLHLEYMNMVLKARTKWKQDYAEAMTTDIPGASKPWCKISELVERHRRQEWDIGEQVVQGDSKQHQSSKDEKSRALMGNAGDGQQLSRQLADVESSSHLACLANERRERHMYEVLSRLDKNIDWLAAKIQELNGYYVMGFRKKALLVDMLYGSDGASDGGGGGDISNDKARKMRESVLLSGEEVQHLKEFIMDTLFLQELFDSDLFLHATPRLEQGGK